MNITAEFKKAIFPLSEELREKSMNSSDFDRVGKYMEKKRDVGTQKRSAKSLV